MDDIVGYNYECETVTEDVEVYSHTEETCFDDGKRIRVVGWRERSPLRYRKVRKERYLHSSQRDQGREPPILPDRFSLFLIAQEVCENVPIYKSSPVYATYYFWG